MWRFAPGYLGSAIPSLLGIDILICNGIDWACYGNYYDSLFIDDHTLFLAQGGLLVIVGLGIFIWRACHRRRYWRSHVALGLLTLAFLIGWWAIIPQMGRAAVARRQASDAAANDAAMAKAIAQIEAARMRLGRVPAESEATDLLEEPLPTIRAGNQKCQIKYHRTEVGEYELTFFCNWDYFVYRSSTPKKGWYSLSY